MSIKIENYLRALLKIRLSDTGLNLSLTDKGMCDIINLKSIFYKMRYICDTDDFQNIENL